MKANVAMASRDIYMGICRGKEGGVCLNQVVIMSGDGGVLTPTPPVDQGINL
jgi:hypothetical protein